MSEFNKLVKQYALIINFILYEKIIALTKNKQQTATAIATNKQSRIKTRGNMAKNG